jgi:predicted MFS family arabinose efflux permease
MTETSTKHLVPQETVPANASSGAPALAAAGKWQQHATRVFFFIGGFGAASWAPLVPVLQQRLQLDEGVLGLLLLCIGTGSLFTMPAAGVAAALFGCRRVLGVAACLYAALLLTLSQAASLWLVVPALLAFGGTMGLLDVTVNIHAVLVEKAAGRSLMSGFHALWSVGGFAGAGLFGVWLQLGFTPGEATLGAAVLMLVLLLGFGRYLLPYGGRREKTSLLALPRGIVVYIALICGIAFLIEGAVMDWSGVFLTTVKKLDLSRAGTGFAVFSAAMLLMRLAGDYLVQHLGGRFMVLGGSGLAILGFLLIIYAPGSFLLYLGFLAIGLGCANVVPIFYSLLGRQKAMPVSMAVAAVSTVGYLGILLGPALIGFIARQSSLSTAFIGLMVLLALQMLAAWQVYRTHSSNLSPKD